MPFQSKAQMGAAFGGYLGSEMKSKASQWARETPSLKNLPMHVGDKPKKPKLKKKKKKDGQAKSI